MLICVMCGGFIAAVKSGRPELVGGFIAGGILSLFYVINLLIRKKKRHGLEGRSERHRIHFSLAIWLACLVYVVYG